MKIKDLKLNPKNPRKITADRLNSLKKSIQDFEKMLELRPIIIDENNIVLGGNMRLLALKELKYKDIPDKWVKKVSDLSEDEKKQFIIKDNVGFGEWDFEQLVNDWNCEQLSDWGLVVPSFNDDDIIKGNFEKSENPNSIYGGASLPVRIGMYMGYIKDPHLCNEISRITEIINKDFDDEKELQLKNNEIAEIMIKILVENEDRILGK